MKHTVTVEVETKKHFMGIPYTTVEKQKLVVDGKTYRKMKREEQEKQLRADSEQAACAAMELEEEFADLFGE